MPERLTPLKVATPEAFVVGQAGFPVTPQTVVPFNAKLIALPLIPALVLAFLSVAVTVTVPPKVPDAGSTVSVVVGRVLVESEKLPALVLCSPSPRSEARILCVFP